MDVIIELTYKTLKGTEAIFTSDKLRAAEAILFAEDFLNTGRLKDIRFIDAFDKHWTLKEFKRQQAEIQTEANNITVYFDGGYHIDTKKSGLGCAIYYEKNGKKFRLRKNALVEGLDSNNEAEYAALYLAIQALEGLDVHHMSVTFIGDSLVVINQLSDEWPCYEEELVRWADRIDAKLDEHGIIAAYEQVSRKKNKEADQLASQALHGVEIFSMMEL